VFSALLLLISLSGVRAQDTLIHYTETTGFDHRTREVSLAMFQQLGEQHNFIVIEDGDGSRFNKADLAKASIVIFSNTSGERGLDPDQQAALQWFVDTLGRNILGIHAATDTYRHSSANGGRTGSWDWYAETLGGSVQTAPNHTSASHVDTIYRVENHPSVERIDFPWVKEEEYYYWENGYLHPDIRVIIEVGETGDNSYDRRRPVGWYRTLPQGSKVFYTSLGHKRENFTGDFPGFERLIEDAVLWMLSCPPSTRRLNAAICEGEVYNFNGRRLREAGTYRANLTNSAGCDSTVTLNLEVLSAKSRTLNEAICAGEVYRFNGRELREAGVYTAELSTAAGCDSMVTLNLEVLSAKSRTLNEAICAGEVYRFNGRELREAGVYTAELSTAAGCDSMVTLNLEVVAEKTTQLSAVICQGETYTFNGRRLDQSGTYSAGLSTAAGCDSTVTLVLNVLAADTTFTSASICAGESYFFGSERTETGTYWHTYQNTDGCDSLVRLRLTVVPPENSALSATICEGESYSFAGRRYTTSGNYTATFVNQAGCDSTVSLSLTVLPPLTTKEEVFICRGESYSFGDRQLTEAGDYQFTFQTAQGCDSTVQLKLRQDTPDTTVQRTSICVGGSYMFAGEELTEAGTYFSVHPKQSGCDSIVQLNIDILPVDTLLKNATLCPGDTLLFGQEQLTAAGTYFATFQDQLGCDSIVQLTVRVTELDTTVVQDGFTLSASLTGAAYQWLDCDEDRQPIPGASSPSFTAEASGNYALRIERGVCLLETACFNVSLTSFSSVELANTVRLFPNPATDRLQVDLGEMRSDVMLEILSITGQRLWTADFDQLAIVPVDISRWPAGMYQLRIRTEGQHAALKFVKR